MDNFSERKTSQFRKGAWPGLRDPYNIWHSLKHISKTSKTTQLDFGTEMHMDNLSKMEK